jgi:hypothetical protein
MKNTRAGTCQIELCDMHGRICWRKNVSIDVSGTVEIPLSSDRLQSGMYMVAVKNEGWEAHLKIIK